MESFWDRIFNEAGLLASMSLAANVILWKAWARERCNRQKEREKCERVEAEFREHLLRTERLIGGRRGKP